MTLALTSEGRAPQAPAETAGARSGRSGHAQGSNSDLAGRQYLAQCRRPKSLQVQRQLARQERWARQEPEAREER